MKRKLAVLAICALVVLVAAVIFSNGNVGKKGAGRPRSLMVTQDGRFTYVSQPDGWATPSVTMTKPKQDTNAASPPADSKGK